MLQELLATPGVNLHFGQIVIDVGRNVSLSDFEAICRENPDLRLEQKATGELVIVAPQGGESSNVCTEISHQLKTWMGDRRLGKIFDSNALYVLPDGSKMSPDVSLVSAPKWKQLSKREREGFMPVVPDFVIEVQSPSDRLNNAQEKMRDWMSNGVLLGWLIDMDTRRAWVYEGLTMAEHVLGKYLAGSGLVQGFTLSIDDIDESLD